MWGDFGCLISANLGRSGRLNDDVWGMTADVSADARCQPKSRSGPGPPASVHGAHPTRTSPRREGMSRLGRIAIFEPVSDRQQRATSGPSHFLSPALFTRPASAPEKSLGRVGL